MKSSSCLQTIVACLAVGSTAAVLTAADTPTYTVLHAFTNGSDGGGLWGSLTEADGSLFGTATGTIFKLTPQTGGQWDFKVLHTFPYPSKRGSDLTCTLIFENGALYGTTIVGGPHDAGTVFKLAPSPTGWRVSVVHAFGSHGPVSGPYAGVVKDASGNLYGVGSGAFELSPDGGGWKETILHRFPASATDGSGTQAGLIADSAGNLYGTTEHGGGSNRCTGGCGLVYELQRQPDGKWKEIVIHRFRDRLDGSLPGVGKLFLDSAGNLYGTAYGGKTGYGVVYKLSPEPAGGWKQTILYDFKGGADGFHPAAGVVMDRAGAFYGTTIEGGDAQCDCGVVFKLAPDGAGRWTYTVLHTFTGPDGAEPDANLIIGRNGNIYGTTSTGGAGGYGVAFEIVP